MVSHWYYFNNIIFFCFNAIITGSCTDGGLTMLLATELWKKPYRGRYAVRFINLLHLVLLMIYPN